MFKLEQLNEVLEDKDFAERYYKIDNIEEAIAALKEKGVEITRDEFQQLINITRIVNAGDDELTDEILEQVAGGIEITPELRNFRGKTPGPDNKNYTPAPLWKW